MLANADRTPRVQSDFRSVLSLVDQLLEGVLIQEKFPDTAIDFTQLKTENGKDSNKAPGDTRVCLKFVNAGSLVQY